MGHKAKGPARCHHGRVVGEAASYQREKTKMPILCVERAKE